MLSASNQRTLFYARMKENADTKRVTALAKIENEYRKDLVSATILADAEYYQARAEELKNG